MRSFALFTALAAISLLACSGDDSSPRPIQHGSTNPPSTNPPLNDLQPPPPAGPAPTPGTNVGTETWADGKAITANVNIPAGSTVTIAPGAKITVSSGVSITVQGALVVGANATHAKLAGPDATTKWGGIVVAKDGTFTADSLDIEGASKAIWTQTGNTDATFANGSIKADTPFNMEAGSKLTITKSSVTATTASNIAGAFKASYLTYDKGTAEGLYANDPAATVDIADSTLTGNGGGDYVVSMAAKTIKLAYTTIAGSHCPQHFKAVDQFTLDHVTNTKNGYGPMLYGSGAGPNTITASNLQGSPDPELWSQYDYDVSGANGKITITGSYVPASTTNKAGTTVGAINVDATNQTAKTVTVTGSVTAPVADAKPR